MKLFYSLRYTFLLLALAVCSSKSSHAQKEYPSLLWEISGNGLTKPSYLYGTMHVSKKVAFHLTDAFFEGLKSTDVVALETNPETWLSELMSEGMSMSRSNYFGSLFGRNNNSFYDKAFDFVIPRNKYIQSQIKREPENVNSLLYRFNGQSDNFEEYTYLDLFIFQSARKSGKKVVALEDFKTSMEMLMKASLPDDEKNTGYTKRRQVPYNIGELVEDAYRNGNLDALDSLNKVSYTSKNFEKYMIADRNMIMANHMDSIMKKQSLFTAVGAAHLPGNLGIITLLRKMGYTVKPVASVVSKKSIRAMDGYEEMHTPLVFSTQKAVDSSFKVDAPGHLFPMLGFDQMDTYLYTDMVNGSYYMVKRIRNYGVMMRQNKEYQEKRIDSILYESIPGKIIKKENIKANNGDPGFDIVNKTRRGDVQHYRIYMSDEYITIFKVAGNGDYVRKSDVDKFFKSIVFEPKGGKGWTTYSPAAGGYELSMPANYSVVIPSANAFQKERITGSDGADFYMFGRSVMNDYYYIEEDTFELAQLAKNFYESFDFELQDKKFSSHLSFPCIDVTAKKKNSGDFLHMRIILKDQQYYLLACTTDKKEQPASFFSSLKFREFRHDKMETYSDTSFFFSVKTDYTEEKKSLLQDLSDPYANYYMKRKKDGDYETWNKSKTIQSPVGSETVEVSLVKSSDYWSDDSEAAMWKDQVDYYKNNTSLYIKNKKRFELNGLQAMDLVLADTNSIKQVKSRTILKGGLLYTLNTTYDSIGGLSPWVQTFYDTFKPADTLIGRSSLEDKMPGFLKDVAAKDSTTREKVNAISNNITFRDKDAPLMIAFIGGPDFNNASLPLKNRMIRALGLLKDPAVLPFLKKEYPKYADSASIQISLLRAMVNQKTTEGAKAFLQSLLGESPLSNDASDVNGAFYRFYDSLELAAPLYPQLLAVTRYPEYKEGVYGLMSTLLDSALIKPAVYEVSKKEMLREANDELKRQITSEEGSTGNNYTKPNYNSNLGGGNDDMSRAIADAMAAAEAAAAAEYLSGSNNNYADPSELLLNYCNLLAPSYPDPAVKSFFGKAFKTKSSNFKIELISILMKNNQPVPDTMIESLSKNIRTRTQIYSALEKLHKTDLIKPEYRSRESLVLSEIFGDRDIPADSIHYITSRYVESKTGSGYVYFYRSTDKEGNITLDLYGSQPKDTTRYKPKGIRNSSMINEKDNISEKIDKLCYELSLQGRKRVKNNYLSDYDFSDYY